MDHPPPDSSCPDSQQQPIHLSNWGPDVNKIIAGKRSHCFQPVSLAFCLVPDGFPDAFRAPGGGEQIDVRGHSPAVDRPAGVQDAKRSRRRCLRIFLFECKLLWMGPLVGFFFDPGGLAVGASFQNVSNGEIAYQAGNDSEHLKSMDHACH